MTKHHLGNLVGAIPIRLRVLMRAQETTNGVPLCAGCGKPLLTDRFRSRDPDRPTIDHILARALGGRDVLGNVVAMHKLCNEMKGDDKPTGCECIWLLAVNCRLGYQPQKW